MDKVAATGRPVGGLRGFKRGWRWGSSSVGLALRRPIYFGLGWVCLGLAALTMAVAPHEAVVMAVLCAIASGLACCGAAARAQMMAGRGVKVPWSAWFTPWGKRGRVKHIARIALGAASLLALGLGAQFGQMDVIKMWGGEYMAAWALTIWVLGMWGCLICVLALAAPLDDWRSWGRLIARGFGAPVALIGWCVFWIVWIALADLALIYVLVSAIEQGGQLATTEIRASMGAFASMVSLALTAPLIAMSAGLACMDLADPEPQLPEPEGGADAVKLDPIKNDSEVQSKAERKAERRDRDARSNG